MAFKLHPRLAADTTLIGDFRLCRALLLNDSRYPWVVLVPRVEAVTEPFQLSETDQQRLMTESHAVLERMSNHYGADKMNVAALGNVVSQLHVHHLARFEGDATWPGPVWGQGASVSYAAEALAEEVETLRVLFLDLLQV